MKRLVTGFIWFSLGSAPLWAMPSQITFQGTLKQQNVPVNATKNMQFSFVDGSGASIPGTAPVSVANVQVTNGLFAVQLPLDPAVPWEQYTAFIQVSVEGQILSPNQPLNANVYAVAAIPQGMIAMFAAACPVGWTRFSTLDNAFPMGGAAYGATGGSATHSHTLGAPTSTNQFVAFGDYQGSGSGVFHSATDTHVHSVSTVSNIPPYVTMVYCQKS